MCDSEFRSVSNVCNDKSFLTCSVFALMMECGLGLGEGSDFQASELSFVASSSRRGSLMQTFVETCVDFEVAHLAIYPQGLQIAAREHSTLTTN